MAMPLRLLLHPVELVRRARRHSAVRRQIRAGIEEGNPTALSAAPRKPRAFTDTAEEVRKASFYTID
jgi:hypothetical protein